MSKPKSEKLCPGVEQIPFESLERLGAIFAEGEKKYGLDNWKTSPEDKEYNTERTRHAIRHLMLYANGDRQEDHLAKVMWYCVTTIWRTNHTTPITQLEQVVGVDSNGIPVVLLPNGTYLPVPTLSKEYKLDQETTLHTFLPIEKQ